MAAHRGPTATGHARTEDGREAERPRTEWRAAGEGGCPESGRDQTGRSVVGPCDKRTSGQSGRWRC